MDVTQEFDQLSVKYTEVINRWLPNYQQLLGGLYAYLPKGSEPDRILDLGCGNGNVTALLSQHFPNADYTLFDASEEMLAVCRERFPQLKLQTVAGYFQEADLPESSYSLISAGLCVHHLKAEEKQALFKSVYRWLQPGGYFTMSDLFIEKDDEPFHSSVVEDWERGARALGTPDEEWAHVMDHYAKYDNPNNLDRQLHWLRQAGFAWPEAVWMEKGAWAVVQAKK